MRPTRRSRAILAIAAVLSTATAVTGPQSAPAAAAGDGVTGLAGECATLRASDGRVVGRDTLGGYRLGGPAEAFRLQATALGRYLLYGTDRRMPAAGPLGAVVSRLDPGTSADWQVDAAGDAFVLTSTSTGKSLGVNSLGSLRLTGYSQAERFTLARADRCATFPEAEVNATGKPFSGQTADGVRGLLDMHLHMEGAEAFGGGLICGTTFDPHGITKALVDCPDHEPGGMGAAFETAVTQAYGPTGAHDTQGWPRFTDFPKADSVTHEQVYWKWLERSWRGGLRVVTLVLVANREICEVWPHKRYGECNEMNQIRRQAERVYALQDYVDAQYRGRGKGWFRVVRDPAEARKVVQQGKLAVVLSIESSEPFDCRVWLGEPSCTEADVDAGLDEVWALGVRHMQLINKFDNAFGGVRFDGGPAGLVVNGGNFRSTGRFWQAETCPADQEEQDNEIFTGEPTGIVGTPLQSLLPGTLPVYPPAPHCNKLGLTDLGGYTIGRMMDRGMVVDLDHFSVKATDEALQVIEARDYPGVVSGHSWLDPHFYARIYDLGGIVTLYGFQSPDFARQWEETRKAHDAHHAEDFFGFGYGSDANGIGRQPTARADAHEHPVEYPFQTIAGGPVMDRQRTGERVFDINDEGVAHYGLRPDWIEDLRVVAGDRIVDDMSKGAEAYLRMWAGAWQAAEG